MPLDASFSTPFRQTGQFSNLAQWFNSRTRAELASKLQTGRRLENGTVVWGGDLAFEFDDTAGNPISDMPGVKAVTPSTPEHHGASGDGTDDTTAYSEWAADTSVLEKAMKSGATYRTDEAQFAAGTTLTTNGAVTRIPGDTAPTGYTEAHVLFGENSTVTDRMHFTAATLFSGTDLVHCFDGCDVEFDCRADSEIVGGMATMSGQNSTLRNLVTRNFARPLVLDATLDGNTYAVNWSADGTATENVADGGTITGASYTRTADFSFKLNFDVPASSPSGCIAEIGDGTLAFYVGFTSGDLVVRFGDGGSGHPSACAKVTFPEEQLLSDTITLYGAFDVSADKLTVWGYDSNGYEVFTITDTALSSITSWASAGDGSVGTVTGTTATGETATDYNDTINSALFWDSSLEDGEPRYAEGFESGGHDLKGITRGWRLIQQRHFKIGGGKIYERSAQAAASEMAGYNGMLFSGAEKGVIESQHIADSGEHAIRIAGPRSNALSFAPLTIIRASASSFKVNASTNLRSSAISIAAMNIIDPCYETGTGGKASHVLRFSHVDGIKVGPVMCTETGDYTLARGLMIAISDCSDMDMSGFATNMDWPLVLFTDQNDLNGDTVVGNHDIFLNNMQCYEPQSGEEVITINMQEATGTIGRIGIDLNILGTRAAAQDIVQVDSATAGYDGPIAITGTMSEITGTDFADLAGENFIAKIQTTGSGAASSVHICPQAWDDANAADTAALFVQDFNGTAGAGNVGAAVILSKIGSGRPGAGIVAGQVGADADQVSLEVWTHSSSTGSNELTIHSRFQHNGPLDLLGIIPELRVNGTQVVGERVIDADLAQTPNSGDANTDLLLAAIVNVLTTHGLGAAS